MTGQWEAYLKRIQRGHRASSTPFIEGIEDYVREVVGKVGKRRSRQRPSRDRQHQSRQREATAVTGTRRYDSEADLHRSAAQRLRLRILPRPTRKPFAKP